MGRPKTLAALGLLVSLSACATGGFPAAGFLQWPSPAGPPYSDWAAGVFERASYAPAPLPGWEISYVRTGEPQGRRVILIHGSPGHAGHWRALMLLRIPDLEIVVPDRPGFGFSQPYMSLPSLADQAAALAHLLDTHDGRPSVVVGWSFGAPIAAQLAVDHPDKVAGLVLVAGAMDPERERVRFVQRVGDLPPFRYFVEDNWRIANEELLPLERELRRLRPKLDDIEVPVHILHGDADPFVPVENVDFMRRAFGGSADLTVQILPGLDHEIPSRRPDLILSAATRLAGLDCTLTPVLREGRTVNYDNPTCDGVRVPTLFDGATSNLSEPR